MNVPHTPGPHSVVQDGQGNNHIVSRWAPDATTEARWTFLAELKTPPVGTFLYKDGLEHVVTKGEDKANADLFASASSLLETAEQLAETLSNVILHLGHHMTSADLEGRKKALDAAFYTIQKAKGAGR